MALLARRQQHRRHRLAVAEAGGVDGRGEGAHHIVDGEAGLHLREVPASDIERLMKRFPVHSEDYAVYFGLGDTF